MEVLDPEHSGINLFDENWKIYSRNSGMTGHRIKKGAVVENSMITDGCVVSGTVKAFHPVCRRAGRAGSCGGGRSGDGRNHYQIRSCGAALHRG